MDSAIAITISVLAAGLVLMLICLAVTAGQADRKSEQLRREQENQKPCPTFAPTSTAATRKA